MGTPTDPSSITRGGVLPGGADHGPIDLAEVHLVDTFELDTAGRTSLFALRQQLDRALNPRRPPRAREEWRRILALDEAHHSIQRRIVAMHDNQAVGMGHIDCTLDPNNLDSATLDIETQREDAGLTRLILRALLRMARNEARSTIGVWGRRTAWRAQFWQQFGVPECYTEQSARLDLLAVDPLVMQTWQSEGERRGPGVTMVHWAGACPTRWMPAFLIVNNAVGDAPQEAMVGEPVHLTTDDIRGEEEAREDAGEELIVLLAVDTNGAPLGTTQVIRNRFRPACGMQWDTVVLRAHRGRGLGKWLKAEMWQRLRTVHTDITQLETGSAASNAGMRAINDAMGFTPTHTNAVWQAEIDTFEVGLVRVETDC